MPFYFTNISSAICQALNSAQNSVLICVAWIDFDRYFHVLDALLKRGVKVQVIVTASAKNHSNRFLNTLIVHGMEFKEITMPRVINHMHNKIAIVDDETVITGSYNWTNNARYNYENVLIEKRVPYEIALLKYEFWLVSCILSPSYHHLLQRCFHILHRPNHRSFSTTFLYFVDNRFLQSRSFACFCLDLKSHEFSTVAADNIGNPCRSVHTAMLFPAEALRHSFQIFQNRPYNI